MNTKRRYAGIQTILQGLKWSDCSHFLDLCSIAEEVNDSPIDLIELLRTAKENRLINEEFMVLDDCGLLAVMTGKTWVQTEVSELPETLLGNEFTEVVFYNPRTKAKDYRRKEFDTKARSENEGEFHSFAYRIYKWS